MADKPDFQQLVTSAPQVEVIYDKLGFDGVVKSQIDHTPPAGYLDELAGFVVEMVGDNDLELTVVLILPDSTNSLVIARVTAATSAGQTFDVSSDGYASATGAVTFNPVVDAWATALRGMQIGQGITFGIHCKDGISSKVGDGFIKTVWLRRAIVSEGAT